MFELCLFDLDETLLRTADLVEIRETGVRNRDPAYLQRLRAELVKRADRHLYSVDTLGSIRHSFPELKLGVFTRSPRSYAETVLAWAYPGFEWDTIIAYEDVRHTKPSGEGVTLAMERLEVEDIQNVVLVGDSVSDVRAAYNAGCWVVLDKTSWPHPPENEHWWALERVPDAMIAAPSKLLEVLGNPQGFLPELERLQAGAERLTQWARYDRVNHFIPKTVEQDKTPYPIFSAGRSFANYESLQHRREWHTLTASIQEQKDAEEFPVEWVRAVRNFIDPKRQRFDHIFIAVIPHRPGRTPRLERFLAQVEASYAVPVRPQLSGRGFFPKQAKLRFVPDLLAYREGVRSNSNDHLNKDDRFINVRDHLFVNRSDLVYDRALYIVIDDVSTTGSTLIYAKKYLEEDGAGEVTLFSLAQNISDVG